MTVQNSQPPGSEPASAVQLDAEIGRLADELGRFAILNDFSGTLGSTSGSESIQKLVLMVNFLLDCAHNALTTVRATLAELAVPTIPVWEDVLMVPLLGALDKERATSLAQSVLPAVVLHRAHKVILDLTGTTSFDTTAAASLLRLSQALRLLGADPIIVGLRPAVAQVLVGMNVELAGFQTQATLQEALRLCIQQSRSRR